MEKKYFNYLAVLILLMQTVLSPVIAIAETEVGPISEELSLLVSNEKGEEVNENIKLKVNESYTLVFNSTDIEEKREEIEYIFSENMLLDDGVQDVTNNSGEIIGKATTKNNQLKVQIDNKKVTNAFSVVLTGMYQSSDDKSVDKITITNDSRAFPFMYQVENKADLVVPSNDVRRSKRSLYSAPVAKSGANDGSTTQQGKEITESIIKKVNILHAPTGEAPESTIESNYSFVVDWDISEEIRKASQPGDYFQFRLPEELTVLSAVAKQPLDSTIDYGYYSVSKDGLVTITLGEAITSHENIKGNFSFISKLNKKLIEVPGEKTIKIPIKDEITEVKVPVNSLVDESIEKSGQLDRSNNPREITWTVLANRAKKNLTNLTVQDEMPEGVTIKEVVVEEAKVDHYGKEIGMLGIVPATEYTVTAGKVTFKNQSDRAYKITYRTVIDEKAKPENGGNKSFYNQVIQTSDEGKKVGATKTIETSYRKLLEKNKTGYDAKAQRLSWEIQYNYGEKSIDKKDAYLLDEMNDFLEVEKETIQLTKMELKNNVFVANGQLENGKDYQVVPTDKGFKVEFLHDLSDAVKVTYNTKVKEGVFIDDKLDIHNKVTTEGNTEAGDKTDVKQQGLVKTVQEGAVDYSAHTIPWQIEVNRNQYEMNQWQLKDTFPQGGLLLQPETLKIKELDGKELEQEKDYTLKDEGEGGFEIIFIGAYKKTSQSFLINYVTSFNPKKLGKDRDENKDKKTLLNSAKAKTFLNSAESTWQDVKGNQHKQKGQATFRPIAQVLSNGEKSGSYNAETKEITWTIDANFNEEILEDAVVTDTIKGNQHFVKDSLSVSTYSVSKDGKKKIDAPIKAKDIQYPSKENDQTIRVALPSPTEKKGYRIVFKTSVEGELVVREYTNMAELTSKSLDSEELKASVTVTNGGLYAEKVGVIDPQDEKFANWNIKVNQGQSTIKGFEIKDYPSMNQVVVADSVVVEEMKANSAGILKPTGQIEKQDEDYTLEVVTDNETGKQTMTITFKKEISMAYQITYRSQLLLGNGKNMIENTVVAAGENEKSFPTLETKPLYVEYQAPAGSASGEQTFVIVKKVGKDLDGKKEPHKLEGVTFELVDTKTNIRMREAVTDKNGEAAFNNILSGTYKLREKNPKLGYFIDTELENGKEIIVTPNHTKKSPQIITIENVKNRVEMQKVNEENQPLEGAVFSLSKKEGENFHSDIRYTNVVATKEGQVVFEELVPGTYQIEETSAAPGYLKNTEKKQFTVTGKETEVMKITSPFVNYLGEATLLKTTDEEQPLSGATFEVRKGLEVVQENVKSNDKGEVSVKNLAPGAYTIEETSAAPGYIKNTESISFEIRNEAEGKPTAIEIGQMKNYQGNVTFKKADKNGAPLAHAIFSLKDGEGKLVRENIVSNDKGQVSINELAPGNYQLEEISAPDGYIRNTRVQSFTIDESAKGKPTMPTLEEFVNYQGHAELKKVNAQGEPLVGATFIVKDMQDKTVATQLKSDKEGKVRVNNLAPGKYMFVETTPAADHMLNDEPYIFEIPTENEGELSIVEVGELINYQGSVEFVKINEEKQPLEGARFSLYTEDGKELRTNLLSDKTGKVSVDELAPGTYYFEEQAAPKAYSVNKEELSFTISEKANIKPEVQRLGSFVNYQGSVELQKVDKHNQPLEGATFALYTEKGDVQVADVQSDAKGKVVVNNLAPGTYYFKEEVAPKGYMLNEKELHFTVPKETTGKPNKIIAGTLVNYRGGVTLSKVDEAGNGLAGAIFALYNGKEVVRDTIMSDEQGLVAIDELAPGHYTLKERQAPTGYILNQKEMSFEIQEKATSLPKVVEMGNFVNYKGHVAFKKISSSTVADGQPDALSNASFDLYEIAETGEDTYIRTVASNENGDVRFDELTPGNYYVVESKAPNGYIQKTRKYAFHIPTATLNQPANAYRDISPNQFVFENYQGSAKLKKVDAKGQPLAGALFDIVDENGQMVRQEIESDESGEVVVENLAPGTYLFKETVAPAHYIRNTIETEFTIDASSVTGQYEADAGELINYQGSVRLTKRGTNDDVLSGAHFALYTSKDVEIANDLVSDEAGLVEVSELAPGDYYFEETEAPSGWAKNTEKVWFTISDEMEGTPETIEVELFNDKGRAKLKKVDSNGLSIAHATFELRDGNQELVGEPIVSDEDGEVYMKNLSPGTYTLTEVVAPTGYIRNTEVVTFVIEETYEEVFEEKILPDFVNYQGTVVLTKESASEKGIFLQDALFELVNETGTVIQKNLHTDTHGKLVVENLSPGKYQFIEIGAPKGYTLEATPVLFEVPETYTGQPVAIQVHKENQKELIPELPKTKQNNSVKSKERKLPQTGEIVTVFLSMLGLFFIVTTMWMIRRKHS